MTHLQKAITNPGSSQPGIFQGGNPKDKLVISNLERLNHQLTLDNQSLKQVNRDLENEITVLRKKSAKGDSHKDETIEDLNSHVFRLEGIIEDLRR